MTSTEPTTSEYCDCPRYLDMWRCQTGGTGECQPGTGKGCALFATLETTGRDRWDGVTERAVKARPCSCGQSR